MAVPNLDSDRTLGCLLGTAVGDALGLPFEGLSRQRAARAFPEPEMRYRLFLSKGAVSDDTQHALLALVALRLSGGTPAQFVAILGHNLRRWFWTFPPGVGLATVKSCLRLTFGIPPHRSGVASAGNGPLMRAPVLGVALGMDHPQFEACIDASTRITHTHPLAVEGARLVAAAAAGVDDPETWLSKLDVSEPWRRPIDAMRSALAEGNEPSQLADRLGWSKGVSGFVVPSAVCGLYCAFRYREDFEKAVTSAIRLGGDADSIGALAGGLVGAWQGSQAIPQKWLDGFLFTSTIPTLRAAPCRDLPMPHLHLMWTTQNLQILPVILLHGFARLFPPY